MIQSQTDRAEINESIGAGRVCGFNWIFVDFIVERD